MSKKITKGNIFQYVSNANVPRSKFDLSHSFKLTGEMGVMYPVLTKEIVPGDKFMINSYPFLRLQPLLAPIMQRIDVELRYFFVPYRLIWDGFESFISESENVGIIHPFYNELIPRGTSVDHNGDLQDYLGVNSVVGNEAGAFTRQYNALPFRAYALIWNEYFRDQNLQYEIPISKASGLDDKTPQTLRRVCWKKDIFTSALPWTQYGQAPTIQTEVMLRGSWGTGQQALRGGSFRSSGGGMVLSKTNLSADAGGNLYMGESTKLAYDPEGTLYTDTISINALREASAVQRFMERQAVGGHRYAESVLSHFGVRTADSRLQRPEYLGGGSIPLQTSDVPQTSQTDATSPQGNLAGKSVASGNIRFRDSAFFTEHGILMAVAYMRPQADYQNVLSKFMMRSNLRRTSRYDFYFPEFANLGEEPIYKAQLGGVIGNTHYNEEWGYTPRYAEMKYYPNEVHGEFKKSLSFWTQTRDPHGEELNSDFVTCIPDSDIFAVDTSLTHDQFFGEIYHNIIAERPMPAFANPSLK